MADHPIAIKVFVFAFFAFIICFIFSIAWKLSPLGTWFRNICKRENQAQEQEQLESSIDDHVIHVNSVSLPTETTVEIPLGTEINFHVELDKPPSYSDLFGKRATFSTLFSN